MAPTDAIVKITSSAICGSDLHMYEGRTTVATGTIFGHEILGVIHEAGEAINQLKVGTGSSCPSTSPADVASTAHAVHERLADPRSGRRQRCLWLHQGHSQAEWVTKHLFVADEKSAHH